MYLLDWHMWYVMFLSCWFGYSGWRWLLLHIENLPALFSAVPYHWIMWFWIGRLLLWICFYVVHTLLEYERICICPIPLNRVILTWSSFVVILPEQFFCCEFMVLCFPYPSLSLQYKHISRYTLKWRQHICVNLLMEGSSVPCLLSGICEGHIVNRDAI